MPFDEVARFSVFAADPEWSDGYYRAGGMLATMTALREQPLRRGSRKLDGAIP